MRCVGWRRAVRRGDAKTARTQKERGRENRSRADKSAPVRARGGAAARRDGAEARRAPEEAAARRRRRPLEDKAAAAAPLHDGAQQAAQRAGVGDLVPELPAHVVWSVVVLVLAGGF